MHRARLGPPASQVTPASHTSGLKEELAEDLFIETVLARNPTVAQMVAAWQAAAARYPQVTSLEDPMVGGKIGPGSIGSNNVDFAYMLEVSQKVPFPGKLKLKGEAASADANAAGRDVEDVRLQLIESARIAFYDYYLVARALEFNQANLNLLREFKKNAETRYATGLVPQQDILQAVVEIGREQERLLNLEEMHGIAVARINTLMHLPPDRPLPLPPSRLPLPVMLPEVQGLRDHALNTRPDIQALVERLRSEEVNLGLARKEFLPDFEFMAGYDAFWQEKELRSQVGMRLNLPVRKDRRYAGLAEAQAKLAQRRAELDRLIDQVAFQLQEAYEKVRKAERAVLLYEKTLNPAAKANVEAAQTAYVTGKIAFLSLVEAQRQKTSIQDRYYETVTDYHRRLATLERVVGARLPDLK